jgi:hypothetical protein
LGHNYRIDNKVGKIRILVDFVYEEGIVTVLRYVPSFSALDGGK